MEPENTQVNLFVIFHHTSLAQNTVLQKRLVATVRVIYLLFSLNILTPQIYGRGWMAARAPPSSLGLLTMERT